MTSYDIDLIEAVVEKMLKQERNVCISSSGPVIFKKRQITDWNGARKVIDGIIDLADGKMITIEISDSHGESHTVHFKIII